MMICPQTGLALGLSFHESVFNNVANFDQNVIRIETREEKQRIGIVVIWKCDNCNNF